jgi:hypothetical protein
MKKGRQLTVWETSHLDSGSNGTWRHGGAARRISRSTTRNCGCSEHESTQARLRRYSERHDEAHGSNSEDPPLPLAQITHNGISRFISRDGDLLLRGGVTQRCQSFHGAEVGKEALAPQFYSFSGGRFTVVVTEPGDSTQKQWRRLRCSGREDRSDTTGPLSMRPSVQTKTVWGRRPGPNRQRERRERARLRWQGGLTHGAHPIDTVLARRPTSQLKGN